MHIELIQTSSLFSGNLYPYLYQVIPWIDITNLIQTSSLFLGNLYPYPSQVIPWIDLPIETPFLESSPRTWKKDLKA